MKTSDFSRFLTQYLTHYLPVQRNLSSNTIRSYRDTFKLLLIFCRDEKGLNIAKLNLAKLDKKCIEDFLLWLTNTRGSSPSTYNQRLCAIHAFFAYVMTEETGIYGAVHFDLQYSEHGISCSSSAVFNARKIEASIIHARHLHS